MYIFNIYTSYRIVNRLLHMGEEKWINQSIEKLIPREKSWLG